MTKVDHIIALLESRIVNGDYAIRPVPAEARLASETGVSRMTARKAVLRLVDRGLLSRAPNGRLVANALRPGAADKSRGKRGKKRAANAASSALIGFLAPAYGSAEIDRWRTAAERVVARSGARLRVTHFTHWDDPILTEAAQSFEGLFLVPPAEQMPAAIARRLQAGRARLVALDADLTAHGIRSIDLVPPSSMQRLLDHLAKLGHRSIHCFNTQPMDFVVQQRIEQWSLWLAAQQLQGRLLNDPDKSYGDPTLHAHRFMTRTLAAGPLGATAVMCVTMPAAIGVMRAMYERGLVVGRDVSLCAANDEGLAAFLCPSLTSTRMPDPSPYLSIALEWMLGRPVASPLLSRPDEVPLFIGESTGKAI